LTEDKLEIEVIDDGITQEVEIWEPGKVPISLLKCSTCYLRKECPYVDFERGYCELERIQTVEINTSEDIVGFIKTLLAVQAKRVIRLVNYEEAEGGIPDPAVTEAMMAYVILVERLKKIVSEEDSLFIRAKGKEATKVLGNLLGDLKGE
jgi:hypothetical protein